MTIPNTTAQYRPMTKIAVRMTNTRLLSARENELVFVNSGFGFSINGQNVI